MKIRSSSFASSIGFSSVMTIVTPLIVPLPPNPSGVITVVSLNSNVWFFLLYLSPLKVFILIVSVTISIESVSGSYSSNKLSATLVIVFLLRSSISFFLDFSIVPLVLFLISSTVSTISNASATSGEPLPTKASFPSLSFLRRLLTSSVMDEATWTRSSLNFGCSLFYIVLLTYSTADKSEISSVFVTFKTSIALYSFKSSFSCWEIFALLITLSKNCNVLILESGSSLAWVYCIVS